MQKKIIFYMFLFILSNSFFCRIVELQGQSPIVSGPYVLNPKNPEGANLIGVQQELMRAQATVNANILELKITSKKCFKIGAGVFTFAGLIAISGKALQGSSETLSQQLIAGAVYPLAVGCLCFLFATYYGFNCLKNSFRSQDLQKALDETQKNINTINAEKRAAAQSMPS